MTSQARIHLVARTAGFSEPKSSCWRLASPNGGNQTRPKFQQWPHLADGCFRCLKPERDLEVSKYRTRHYSFQETSMAFTPAHALPDILKSCLNEQPCSSQPRGAGGQEVRAKKEACIRPSDSNGWYET